MVKKKKKKDPKLVLRQSATNYYLDKPLNIWVMASSFLKNAEFGLC